MAGWKKMTAEPASPLAPRPDWTLAAETRRTWVAEAGGDSAARLGFLADHGLRLLMADTGPGGEETLHFYSPRDRETVHVKTARPGGLLAAGADFFPAAARWRELVAGSGREAPELDAGSAFLERGGMLLEARGGRIRRVREASREYPQGALRDTRAKQAALVLEEGGGREGTARAAAFVQALEDARGVKVPLTAQALRAAIAELSLAGAHLQWLRDLAAILGRPGAAAGCGELIGKLQEGVEEWLGAPQGRGWIAPGGVGEDLPLEGAPAAAKALVSLADLLEELKRSLLALPVPAWAERRLRPLGERAEKEGWAGPLARSAGLEVDARREEPGVYAALGWSGAPPASTGRKGGLLRRMLETRFQEASLSLRTAALILGDLPPGPLRARRGRGGRGEGFGRCEGPDGEVCCHVVLEKGRVERLAFSLPRELNRSAARCLEGAWLDEVPVLSLIWESPSAPPPPVPEPPRQMPLLR